MSTDDAETTPTGVHLRRRCCRAVLAVVALGLVAGGWLLPLWQARLLAPQYPGGLTTIAYGNRVTGDLREINGLNHYVGLGVFDPSNIPEMQFWPVAILCALAAVVVAMVHLPGIRRRIALTYLWGLPFGVLVAIQFRLYEFGHDVTSGAAFRIDPFTPWVIGRTTVWNFETWAWPGMGLVALVVAAVVVTFGPRMLCHRRRRATVVLAAVLILAPALAVDSPAVALNVDGNNNGVHGDHAQHEQHDDRPQGTGGVPAPIVGPGNHGGHGAHSGMPTVTAHPVVGALSDLLADVEDGGTLHLGPGTYIGPVVIDRPVVIEGTGLPIIRGNGAGSVITVTAPGTVIRGVVVEGSGAGPTDNPAGIRIEADGVTVENVIVRDSYTGIAVDSVARIRLVGNHLHGRAHASAGEDKGNVHDMPDTGADPHLHDDHDAAREQDENTGHVSVATGTPSRGDAIWLHDVDHVLVRGNHIEHARDGVYVSFGAGALVDSNHVHASRYAVHTMFAQDLTLVQNHFSGNLAGMVLMYGQGAILLRNHVEGHHSASTGFAMILKDIVDVEVVQNLLVDNRIGIHLDGPTESRFVANSVIGHHVGVQAHSSALATFTGNSFVRNTIQVVPLGSPLVNVVWVEAGFGNFWDTYRGFDANGNGRGSVPHVEGGNVDRLLTRHPELLAIANTPAVRLLRSVEERWGRRAPAAVDDYPLTKPMSPALTAPTADPGASVAAWAIGAMIVLPAGGLYARFRRPTPTKRILDAPRY